MIRQIWLLSLVCVVQQLQCVDDTYVCGAENDPASMSMLELSMLQVSLDVNDLRDDNSSFKSQEKELLQPVMEWLDPFGQQDAKIYYNLAGVWKQYMNKPIPQRPFPGFWKMVLHNNMDIIIIVAWLVLACVELLIFLCFGISSIANLALPVEHKENLPSKGKADVVGEPWHELGEVRSSPSPQDSLAEYDEVDRLAFLPFLCISLGAHAMCCTDSYVPNMPEMEIDLRVSSNLMALTLPVNWMVKGVASLVVGTYSDVVGRKPVMMLCCLMILLSSMACASAKSFETFLAARVLQGFGEGGDAVVQAIIRDKYPDMKERQKIMSLVQATMMLSPMLAAPGFGLLGTYIGWRLVFVIMTVWGAMNLALCAGILQHERPRQRISFMTYVTTAKNILTSKPLVALLGVLTLTWCSKQTALSSLAFVLEGHLGLSAQGVVLALALIPLFVPPGIIIAARGSQRTSPTYTLKVIMLAQFFAVLMFLLSGLLFSTHVWGIVAPYCIGATLNMAALATAITIFMQPLKEFAGVAAGVLSCTRELLGGIAALVGSQICISTTGAGLMFFNGGMLTLMLVLFWSWFGISTPDWAYTVEEKAAAPAAPETTSSQQTGHSLSSASSSSEAPEAT